MKTQTKEVFCLHIFVAAIFVLASVSARSATQVASQLAPSSTITNVGGGRSYDPIVTPDGRFALFASTSGNLATTPGGQAMPEYTPGHVNVFLRDRQTGVTTLVSVNAAGGAGGNGDSFPSAISSNGQYAVFESIAADLVPNDTNSVSDVFVRDTVNNITTLVSVSTNGSVGNGSSLHAAITPNGRYVAFASAANNLVTGDTNGIQDVFVRDLQRGVTTLASPGAQNYTASTTTPFTPGSASEFPVISVDGRYVAFYSTAIDLVTNVTSSGELYVRDLVQGTTAWVSTNAHMLNSSAASANYAMSANGQWIAYQATGGTQGGLVFLYNVLTGASTEIITNGAVAATLDTEARNIDVSANGQFVAYTLADSSGGQSIQLWNAQSNTSSLISGGTAGAYCDFPRVDQTGRYVAFISVESSLTTNSNGSCHCYLRDTLSNTVQMADVVPNGSTPISFIMTPFHLSADGSALAFDCLDGSLSINTNKNDAFLHSFSSNSTEILSVPSSTLPSVTPLNSSELSVYVISSNGQWAAFVSYADGLVSGDTNGYPDVFVHDLVSGSNTLVSVSLNGSSSGNGPSTDGAISGNGRFVAFTSSATNLVANDTNNASDVFLRDLQTGTTILVSQDVSSFGEGNRNSYTPQISTDGQGVLFTSQAINLTTNTRIAGANLFWRDMQAGVTYALTTNGFGAAAMTLDGSNVIFSPILSAPPYQLSLWNAQSNISVKIISSIVPLDVAISADALRAAYDTSSGCYGVDLVARTNWQLGTLAATSHARCQFSADDQFLVHLAKDSNGTNQVYLYEFQNSSSVLVSQSYNNSGADGSAPSDSPNLSANGRYVAYRSAATNLVPNDTNGEPDVFLYDRLTGGTTLISVSQFGPRSGNAQSFSPVFSADSQSLFFQSWASDLVSGDFNESGDVFAVALSINEWGGATNGATSLNFTGLTGSGNSQFSIGQPLTLTWTSTPGAGYQVQFKNNLTDPQWQDLPNPATVLGGQGSIIDSSPNATNRFYRIISF